MPSRRPRYHHGNLYEAAIEAGVALVDEVGADRASLRLLAQRLGVSHRALYNHFGDRDAWLAAVAARVLGVLLADMRAAVEAGDGGGPDRSRTALEAAITAYVDFALDRPRAYRLAFTAGFVKRSADRELRQASKRLGRELGLLVVHAMRDEAGGPGGDERHPPGDDALRDDALRDAAITLWAAVHGLVDLYLGGSLRARSRAAARAYIREQVAHVLDATIARAAVR